MRPACLRDFCVFRFRRPSGESYCCLLAIAAPLNLFLEVCVMRSLCVMFAVVGVLGFACPSYGMVITANIGSGPVTEFYDNFEEAGVLGTLPNNGTYPGDWAVTESSTTVKVLNSGVPLEEGSQFLRVKRNNNDAYGQAVANMADRLTNSAWQIHAEWMMYVPTASGYQANIHLEDSTDGAIRTALLLGANAAGTVQYLTGGNWVNATPTYTPDTWQKWTMDYQVQSSQFTFSITTPGGSTQSQTVAAAGAGEIGRMFFGCNPGGSTYYIDAVPAPEPSSIALLVTGLIGLLAYAWRKRK